MGATVQDVMTVQVMAVRKNAPAKEIVARLRAYRVSAFPVIDEDNIVVGVVSEADLLAKEALSAEETGPLSGLLHHRQEAKAAGVLAGELMTSPAVTIGPDAPVSRAARLMHDRKIKRLPVVDAGGRLVGIISRTDVLSVFSRPDEDIHHDITTMISDKLLMDPASFTVTVRDGVVTLKGRPETVTLGRLVVGEARHVEGVVGVRDRLTYSAREPVPTAGPYF